jgi:hypothetical protein
LITRGDVVLRLQGSGLCDLKLDRCVASDQIDSYLEPNGRSEITSPSEGTKHITGAWVIVDREADPRSDWGIGPLALLGGEPEGRGLIQDHICYGLQASGNSCEDVGPWVLRNGPGSPPNGVKQWSTRANEGSYGCVFGIAQLDVIDSNRHLSRLVRNLVIVQQS